MIEAALLKGAVGALTHDRAACHRCRRTPLVGERVYRFERAAVICELCRPAQAGEPVSSELVRSAEQRSVTPLRGPE